MELLQSQLGAISDSLSKLTTLLNQLRQNPTSDDAARREMEIQVEHSNLLSTLEVAISELCRGIDSKELIRFTTTHFGQFDNDGPISHGIVEMGIHFGVLEESDKSQILGEKPWSRNPVSSRALLDELPPHILFLEQLVQKMRTSSPHK